MRCAPFEKTQTAECDCPSRTRGISKLSAWKELAELMARDDDGVYVTWSTDIKNLLDVWTHMGARERVRLMEVHPDLYTALTSLSHENDHLIMQAQRQFRRDAINLKVGSLRENGAHVPDWMQQEASVPVS
jgi:hypothetical protein